MIYLTRRAEFCASHRLNNPALTPEQNRELYGNCNNPNGHGHTYYLEVTVRGVANPETGMVINLRTLKEIINTHAIEPLDHKNLNADVPMLANVIPTAENIIMRIWKALGEALPAGCNLHELKLWETDNSAITYRGE